MKTLKTLIKYVLIPAIALALWGFIIISGTMNGWWHSPITNDTTNDAFLNETKQKINNEFVGNLAIALFKNGKIESEYYYSKGKPIDRNTVFQVASMSKWVSAFGIMKLVEQGKLDLDEPVSKYLTRWQLPKSEFNNDEVTVRSLLSHTSGLTDGLGYSGFNSIKNTQTLEESLTKASDADEGISGEVKLGLQPGTEFKYSGGGYTLLQLIVEEVSRQTFSDYMLNSLFRPLGMNQSSYRWEDLNSFQLVEFYNADGSKAPHFRYTSLAATSLYTTIGDLEIFFNANLNNTSKTILTQETLKQMRTPHASTMGMDIWGLGTMLFAKKDGDFIIGHDGKSTPPINTAMRLHPKTGNGIIVLETGNPIMASTLASEWVFWSENKIDLVLFTMKKDGMISAIGMGWIGIILIAIFIAIYKFSKRSRTNKNK